jgi:hypothetical protein
MMQTCSTGAATVMAASATSSLVRCLDIASHYPEVSVEISVTAGAARLGAHFSRTFAVLSGHDLEGLLCESHPGEGGLLKK